MIQEYLTEALEAYGLSDAKSEFLRHNENLVYKISTNDKKCYLLRIHLHKDGFTAEAVESGLDRVQRLQTEMDYLCFLYSKGLVVQRPIENRIGKFVTIVRNHTPVTMLSFLPGRNLTKEDICPELCEKLGVMVYQMNEASEQFLKQHETRPTAISYDASLCDRVKDQLRDLQKDGKIGKRETEVMLSCLQIIREVLLIEGEHTLCHNDLSLSNILLTENGLVPIDFSLCGYGNRMMDLGCLFACITGGENRSAVLKGYERDGEKIDFKGIDSSFAMNVMLSISLHKESWPKEEWFIKRLPGWCEEIFQPMIDCYKNGFNGSNHMINLTY